MSKFVTTPIPLHYVMWRFKAGGVELSVNHYINRLANQRELNAYSLRGGANEIYDAAKIKLQPGNPKSWQCYRNYFNYCKKHKKAIFHLLNVGPIVLLITLLAGVKNPIYHVHGTVYWKNGYQKPILKLIWWLTSLWKVTFVANSAYSASIFRDQVIPVQPNVVYNGFEVNKYSEKRSLRTSLRKIGYAGRFNIGKNVELVIRLFEEMAANHPHTELLLAGDGPLRKDLEALAQKSPYRDRIHFLGFVQDIATFYGSIDLLLFLSAYESFGNVLAEALLTGLPILTSDVPVFSEIHNGEKDFQLGNPNDYETIKQKFLIAINDYNSLAHKAFAMSDQVKEKFSLDQHLTQIERIYERY